MCDIFLWTPSHGRAKAGRPARSYIQQLCADTGCCIEERWTTEKDGGKGSGKFALAALNDDDDDDDDDEYSFYVKYKYDKYYVCLYKSVYLWMYTNISISKY